MRSTRNTSCSLALPLAAAMLAAACGSPGPPETPATPAPSPAPTVSAPVHESLEDGIDVSSHSGTVDWQAIRRAGHTFAFVKASEGVDLPDPRFAANWEAAGAAGLVRGAYHFYVTEDDPAAQAQLFIDTVDLEPGDLAPVVDIELIGHGTRPGLADRLRRFLEILEEHYEVRPIIYTSPNFWNAHLDDTFGHHPLWVAEYGVDQPALPKGWDRWHLWQWQGDAEVEGVEKGADLSRVNQDLEDLHRLVVPAG